MRIGIDARTILYPDVKDNIGNGHYTFQLIKHILESNADDEYVLFFDQHTREKDVVRFQKENVKIVFYPFSAYGKFLPGMYNEILTAATLSREKLDVLHVTSASTRIPASYRGKVIVTFNDLGVYKTPESYKRGVKMRTKTVYGMMARKATHIIAASDAIAQDMHKMLSVPEEKITTVYGGVDGRFFDAPRTNYKKVAGRFGITKKYILFVGTINPVKNITRLLHAFALFQEERKQKRGRDISDYQLLVVGKPGWLANDIKHFVHDLGLSKSVKFGGYVIGDDMVPLYRGAEFAVLPSLYEGFGSTVLEAFATETPLIVSNVGSVPEIVEEAARLINPVDAKELAQAMGEFANDEELRGGYVQKALVRVKDFNWEKTARETIAIYHKAIAE